jgi:hypothetical protein
LGQLQGQGIHCRLSSVLGSIILFGLLMPSLGRGSSACFQQANGHFSGAGQSRPSVLQVSRLRQALSQQILDLAAKQEAVHVALTNLRKGAAFPIDITERRSSLSTRLSHLLRRLVGSESHKPSVHDDFTLRRISVEMIEFNRIRLDEAQREQARSARAAQDLVHQLEQMESALANSREAGARDEWVLVQQVKLAATGALSTADHIARQSDGAMRSSEELIRSLRTRNDLQGQINRCELGGLCRGDFVWVLPELDKPSRIGGGMMNLHLTRDVISGVVTEIDPSGFVFVRGTALNGRVPEVRSLAVTGQQIVRTSAPELGLSDAVRVQTSVGESGRFQGLFPNGDFYIEGVSRVDSRSNFFRIKPDELTEVRGPSDQLLHFLKKQGVNTDQLIHEVENAVLNSIPQLTPDLLVAVKGRVSCVKVGLEPGGRMASIVWEVTLPHAELPTNWSPPFEIERRTVGQAADRRKIHTLKVPVQGQIFRSQQD